jgi:molecular chaperone Hsp33
VSGGRFVRCLTHDGSIRVLVVVAPGAADEVRQRHGLTEGSALMASDGMVASLLLSAYTKGEERILLEMAGLNPKFTFSGEALSDGQVRARFNPPDLPARQRLVGRLVAIKWDARREVYRGVAEMDHDSMEGALQAYLVQSQQARGRVRLESRMGEDGRIIMASGMLVELIPDTMEPEQFEALVDTLMEADLDEILTAFAFGQLLGSEVQVLEARDVRFTCACSIERVEATLRALGAADLRELKKEQGAAEVTCHFCGEVYSVPGDRILELAVSLDE